MAENAYTYCMHCRLVMSYELLAWLYVCRKMQLICTYTVVHKKRDTFIFPITLANIDAFS